MYLIIALLLSWLAMNENVVNRITAMLLWASRHPLRHRAIAYCQEFAYRVGTSPPFSRYWYAASDLYDSLSVSIRQWMAKTFNWKI